MSLRRPALRIDELVAEEAENTRDAQGAVLQGPVSVGRDALISRGLRYAESAVTAAPTSGTHVNVVTLSDVSLDSGRIWRISGNVTLDASGATTTNAVLCTVAWGGADILVPTDSIFDFYARVDSITDPVTVEFSRCLVGTGRLGPISLFVPFRVSWFTRIAHQLRVEDVGAA